MGGIERDLLADALWQQSESGHKEFHVRGRVTAVNDDGTLSIRLGGSSVDTVCSRLYGCNAEVGDIALVFVDRMGTAVAVDVLAKAAGLSPALIQAIYDIQYPVGHYMYTDDDGDISDTFRAKGVLLPGVWEDIEGVFLFAANEKHPVGDEFGSETVTLGKEHIPPHSHGAIGWPQNRSDTYSFNSWTSTGWPGVSADSSVGGGQPHDNMPPARAVRLVHRVS